VLTLDHPSPGSFCWLDLAATDAACAKTFYAQAFGWTFQDLHINGGVVIRCLSGDREVGSIYQMKRAQLERGVPSHWTPYIRVDDVDALARQVPSCGGLVLVAPFDVGDTARIALIQDAVGALIGLWEPRHCEDPGL
jgi:uncharacterized protein